jgi:hypothetical protein
MVMAPTNSSLRRSGAGPSSRPRGLDFLVCRRGRIRLSGVHIVFVAGAAGAIGKPLVTLLVQGGHRVFGTTRSKTRAANLERSGVSPIVLDVFDRQAVADAIKQGRAPISDGRSSLVRRDGCNRRPLPRAGTRRGCHAGRLPTVGCRTHGGRDRSGGCHPADTEWARAVGTNSAVPKLCPRWTDLSPDMRSPQ